MSTKLATWPENVTFWVAENELTDTANWARHEEDTQIWPVEVGLQGALHPPQFPLSPVVLMHVDPHSW
jgi:hypothetical protein